MSDIVADSGSPAEQLTAGDYYLYLKKINLKTLDSEEIKASQGSAGIKAIYDSIYEQVLV